MDQNPAITKALLLHLLAALPDDAVVKFRFYDVDLSVSVCRTARTAEIILPRLTPESAPHPAILVLS